MKDLKDRKFVTKKDRYPARIVNDDRTHPTHPVTVYVTEPDGTESIHAYTKELKYDIHNGRTHMDLVEVFPWSDFAQGAPVVCWDVPIYSPVINYNFMHFAGVAPDGRPMTFPDGKTPHSYKGVYLPPWDNCVSLEEYQLMTKEIK